MMAGDVRFWRDNPDGALVEQHQAEALDLIRQYPDSFVLVVPDPDGTKVIAAGSTQFMAQAAVAAKGAANRMFLADVATAMKAAQEEADE